MDTTTMIRTKIANSLYCHKPVLTLVVLMCVGLSSAAHLDDPEPASEEIFYNTEDTHVFRCQVLPHDDSLFINWYINGMRITRQTQKHMRSWRVIKTTIDRRYLHGNELTLKAEPSAATTATVFCTVKGRYRNNIVKVFNLVRDIERRPSGPLLGRADDTQKCPLYPGQTLTLTCENAIKYMHVTRWIWERDSVSLHNEHVGQLMVTEPGLYTCSFQVHSSGQKELLMFKVIRATRKSAKVKVEDRDWEFCKYSSNS